jgi:hypothetical protein
MLLPLVAAPAVLLVIEQPRAAFRAGPSPARAVLGDIPLVEGLMLRGWWCSAGLAGLARLSRTSGGSLLAEPLLLGILCRGLSLGAAGPLRSA